MSWLLVAVGAAVGAPLRYLVDSAVQRVAGGDLPYGTLAVNVTGSLAVGVLVGSGIGSSWFALLGTGLCGGFTTYSAYAYETVALARDRRSGFGLLYALGSLALGLAAALGGLLVGQSAR